MSFAGGSGSSSDPYVIEDWNHLDSVRDNLTDHFILNSDLDSTTAGYDTHVANPSDGWEPIGDTNNLFEGEFDGDGYSISDLVIDRVGESNLGLFGYTGDTGVVFQNVDLFDIDVSGDSSVAGLVGHSGDGATIQDVSVTGSIEAEGCGAVTAFASSNASLSNLDADVTVSGSGVADIGGIVGILDNADITDSSSSGTINAGSSDACGGLVGTVQDGSYISNSHSTMDVTGASYVGGLVGSLYEAEIDNSYATSQTLSGDNTVGGLVGFTEDGTIKNSYAEGTVNSADEYAGGLVGYAAAIDTNEFVIQSCHAKGDVTGGPTGGAGGLVGWQTIGGSVTKCYAEGDVTGEKYVGGFVGYSGSVTVTECNARGSIQNDSNDYTGGFVGYAYNGEISDCYSRGDVDGENETGGFIGYTDNDITVARVYSTASSVTGSTNVGGFAGTVSLNNGSISEAYWDSETNTDFSAGDGVASGDDSGVTALTTDEMQGTSAETNMTGFDFDNVWSTVT